MTLECVMHEIRETEAQPNSAKVVYDLADAVDDKVGMYYNHIAKHGN